MYSYKKMKVQGTWFTLPEDTMVTTYGSSDTKFVLGDETYCLRCNKYPITRSATFMCDRCESTYGHLDDENYGYCASCGRHFNLNHGIELWDGDYVCGQCVDAGVVKACDCCGNYVYTDLLTYNEKLNQYLCNLCAAEDI